MEAVLVVDALELEAWRPVSGLRFSLVLFGLFLGLLGDDAVDVRLYFLFGLVHGEALLVENVEALLGKDVLFEDLP